MFNQPLQQPHLSGKVLLQLRSYCGKNASIGLVARMMRLFVADITAMNARLSSVAELHYRPTSKISRYVPSAKRSVNSQKSYERQRDAQIIKPSVNGHAQAVNHNNTVRRVGRASGQPSTLAQAMALREGSCDLQCQNENTMCAKQQYADRPTPTDAGDGIEPSNAVKLPYHRLTMVPADDVGLHAPPRDLFQQPAMAVTAPTKSPSENVAAAATTCTTTTVGFRKKMLLLAILHCECLGLWWISPQCMCGCF
jgi:hypothetical protein